MTGPWQTPLILGHRGSPTRAPENSLRSLALALEEGADGVEVDVQLSADGVPVLIHDPTLERTGHGQGRVGALPWSELARLSGGGEPLASLEQAAAWAADSGAWLNVEIKAEGAERAALEVLRRAGVLPRTVLSSFSARTMERLGELAPEALRFLLAEQWNDGMLEAAASADVRGVCLRVDAASHLALDVLRREGYATIVWTVDEPARMRELLRSGVSGIITNHPERAVQARNLHLAAPDR
jgi:glycerophosphoryl diester phosphodiesterase